jgi:hypothetical protein
VIGESRGGYPRKDGQRRRRVLLLLLLSAIAVSWIFPAASAGLSEGFSPQYSPAPSVPASGATASRSPISSTPTATGIGDGSGTAQMAGVDFGISGDGAANLRPGVTTAIPLTLTNPNGVPIYVTALTVSIAADSTPPGCSSASNVEITQSNASGAAPITVPARSSVTLTSAPRAPRIMLLNLPGVNQDVCKNRSFVLTYRGSARS